MTNFVAWIPPAGAVVDPPVHPLTAVRLFWSDESITGPQFAGDVNWSGEGDGFSVVAYAVIEEYTLAPKVAREFWVYRDGNSIWQVKDTRTILTWDEAIHVREVLEGREVVAWAVVRDGEVEIATECEGYAMDYQRKRGGTVRPLGFLS